MELKLETKETHENETFQAIRFMVTPPVAPDYWLFRVAVSTDQAVVGFLKFNTIGIGFQVEDDDWNTNLPYQSTTEELYAHIACNKGDTPTREDCIAAIRMVQAAAVAYMLTYDAQKQEGT